MKDFKKQIINNIFPIITVIVMIIFWHILSLIINMQIVLPKPSVAFKEFIYSFTNKNDG
jgi:ABC-type nitrate/sulfonate/bicarbonate transport system permease component